MPKPKRKEVKKMIKAKIEIIKNFDDNEMEYQKEWKKGDFEEFFKLEGEYMDKLAQIVEEHGKENQKAILTITVEIKKEKGEK
jgi:guanylate kinase